MDIAQHAGPLHDRDAVEQRVLEIVGALVMELRGVGPRPPVALGDSLERDLGISSLERVELLLRLEREFGVRLPDGTMAEADAPRDLVAALLRAAPAGRPAATIERPPLKLIPMRPMRPVGDSSELVASHKAACSIRSVSVGVISKRKSSAISGVTTVTLALASSRARAMRRGSSMPAACRPDTSSTVCPDARVGL